MKCDFCDSKASVFLTQLVEGQMKKVCLCNACAKERGVTDPTGFSLADLLMGGPVGEGKAIAVGAPVPMPHGQGTCTACGFTLEDLRRVRRLGCSECYTTFRDELSPMIRGMHKGTSHHGKVPAGLMERQVLRQRLEELQAKLDKAVAAESYEEAAGIRDEIRQLNESLVS